MRTPPDQRIFILTISVGFPYFAEHLNWQSQRPLVAFKWESPVHPGLAEITVHDVTLNVKRPFIVIIPTRHCSCWSMEWFKKWWKFPLMRSILDFFCLNFNIGLHLILLTLDMKVSAVSCTDHVHLRYRSHTSHLHVHLYQERRSWDNSLEPPTSFVLLTCEVWPETVVVVVQETVQQLTHVVGRLVGQQAAGNLPAILPLSGLAGKRRNIEIFHFLYYKLMTNFHSSKLIKPILTFIITSSSKQKWCSKKSADTFTECLRYI